MTTTATNANAWLHLLVSAIGCTLVAIVLLAVCVARVNHRLNRTITAVAIAEDARQKQWVRADGTRNYFYAHRTPHDPADWAQLTEWDRHIWEITAANDPFEIRRQQLR